MHPSSLLLAAASGASAAPVFAVYFEQWHTASLSDRATTAGVTHIITAFAQSTIFNSGTWYTPFMPLDQVRALFDDGTKVCMAIGGWSDTSGFSAGAATEQTRKTYAQNVATIMDNLGYDCVDVDWEYPGGNGQDYRIVPNDQKVQEVETFPLLLQEIKAAIGDRELSIAVPGKEGDMIAFTADKVPLISEAVDHVNVMSYDLMNRRNNETMHHSGIPGPARAVDLYIERGMEASKLVLGFTIYSKWFTTSGPCDGPEGCATAELERPDGTDTGLSGAVTFEKASYSDGEFAQAMQNGKVDEQGGGQWYWANSKLWTWDKPALITRKFDEIVKPKGLGGVMAWSLAQDSHDWSHLKAVREGVGGL
ncbi:uncharacterized protein J7T54_007753 [Emericellopsis cladophorae]|uniref:chitinase n=1 Tax=Emericellopsis cladophorae TaxID=2686198 RepID=A0A9Q0BC05_9HYPO|nr:uncharacterized protein J7T54_007753 [Emericellopsis cladophorae]KAI6779226.1 hypothetical protein J7T54_007753 [Emericellopsis cladophorae]